MNTLPANAGPSTGTTNKKNKKGKKKTLTKSDIGAPTNFQFVISAFFHIDVLLIWRPGN